MSGAVALVRAAELLAELAGSRTGAATLATSVLAGDTAPLDGGGDFSIAVRAELIATGVLTKAGAVDTARAAELITVCHILAASSLPTPAPPPDPRLVLSAPTDSVPIADRERLSTLVLDVIRKATTTLHIGGGFWNDAGFDLLAPVLQPAVRDRSIPTRIYANVPERNQDRTVLATRLGELEDLGPVTLRWYTGKRPTMLHAKFVVADRRHGYLGTANLTSWGMGHHIEAGVELTAGQSDRFVTFLEDLEQAALFTPTPGP